MDQVLGGEIELGQRQKRPRVRLTGIQWIHQPEAVRIEEADRFFLVVPKDRADIGQDKMLAGGQADLFLAGQSPVDRQAHAFQFDMESAAFGSLQHGRHAAGSAHGEVGLEHSGAHEPDRRKAEVEPLALDDLRSAKDLEGDRLPRHQGHVAWMQPFPRPALGLAEHLGLEQHRRDFASRRRLWPRLVATGL